MAALIRAQEAAQEDISAFDADLVVSGFGPKSRGLAKKLYDAFAEVAAKTMETELADMPWMVVRGLALELNNEHASPEGACALLEGLLNHKTTAPSQAVIDKLTVDERTLRRNRKWEELNGASADVAKGISLVTELLDGTDADERAALLQLKTALERKGAAANRKRAFWGLVAAAFVGFLIYDANKKPSYSPRPLPTTSFTPSTPPPSFSPNSTSSLQTDEQIPLPGTDRAFNRSEVRYCIFQGERLTILRDLLYGDPEINRFNALVDDFNTRCSSYRYRQGVLQAIEAEVPGQRRNLGLEVQRLLSSWRGSRASSPAPSASESLIDIAAVSGATLVQKKLKELGYYDRSSTPQSENDRFLRSLQRAQTALALQEGGFGGRVGGFGSGVAQVRR